MEKFKTKSTIALLAMLIVSICMILLLNVSIPSPTKASTEPFTMDNGAQIRTVEGQEGIRFIAEMTPDYYEGVVGKAKDGTTVEFGMCLKAGTEIESYLYGGTNQDLSIYKPLEKWDNDFNPQNDQATKYVYKFAITGIKAVNYNTPISALAYAKYTDKTDDQVKYEYAKFDTNKAVVTRSIFEVAVKHSQGEMGDEATFVNGLIATVMPDESAITLSKEAYVLKQGDTADLFKVTVGGVEIPAEIQVTDEQVATIENGVITAVKSSATEAKTTTITATIGNVTKTATVKVKGEVTDDNSVTLANGIAKWDTTSYEKVTFNGFNAQVDLTEYDSFDVIEYGVKYGGLKNGYFHADFVLETSDRVITKKIYTGVQGVNTGSELLEYINTKVRLSTYYVLNNDIYIESDDPNGAILKGEFKGTIFGNGHKIVVNKETKFTKSTSSANPKSVLFENVGSNAIIKNTIFDITYQASSVGTEGARIGALVNTFSGILQDCYIKTNRIDDIITSWEASSVIYNLKNGKIENCIFETENRYITGWCTTSNIENALVISKNDGVKATYNGVDRYLSYINNSKKVHGFNNVSIYNSAENLLSGNGVKVIDGVTVENTNETLTNTPQYTNDVFGDDWTFDTENGVIALNGNDVTNLLGATYSGGVISWNDLSATQTEVYVDGVKKTDVTLDGQSFAAADYLVENKYDTATAHTVEIRVTDGTYIYSNIVRINITVVADETAFRAIDGATASDYFLLTDNITIADTAMTAMIANFGGTLDGNGYKVIVTRAVESENKNGTSILFGTVSNTAVIKNTQFDITYLPSIQRTAAFAGTYSGILTNCYIKTTRTSTVVASPEESSVIYTLGGKLINNIFETGNKHIVTGVVSNSDNYISGALIVRTYGAFRVGNMSGIYTNITNVGEYSTFAKMLEGTGNVVSVNGSSYTRTATTNTPQYTNVFTAPWAFTDSAVTLCGKTVG